ncbi:MAG: hypothetical protein HZB38_01355 [Planctomycetes bacterium]|nr:hypothetical protein [Planctomycetota bacterium]
MKTLFTTIVAAAAATAAIAAPHKSVLKNGSFEVNANDPNHPTLPLNWTEFGGAEQSADRAWHGQKSCLSSVRVNPYVGMYQDPVSIPENVRVLMKTRAFIPSAAPITDPIVAGMKLEFFPPEGIELPPPIENLAFDVNSPLDTWVLVSLTTTVPANVDTAKIIMISFDNSSTNGFIYCDSASAEFGSAPGVNQLLCPSFECGSSGPDGMNPPWDEFADALSGARKMCFNPPARDGLCVLGIGGPATAGVAQQISVTAGDTITVSGYFKSLSTNPYNDPNAFAGVKIEWVVGSIPTPNIDVVPNANPISGTTNIVNSASPQDQWVPIYIDYTMPNNNAAKLRGTLINAFGPGICDVYFDGFEMVLMNVFDGSDADGDDDEDMLDMAHLQQAYTGGGAMIFGGLVFDRNEDGFVNTGDLDLILPHLVGPVVAP